MPKASQKKNDDSNPEPESETTSPAPDVPEAVPDDVTETPAASEEASSPAGDSLLPAIVPENGVASATLDDETGETPRPWTPERAFDVALGVVVVAAETLNRASRQLQENGPAVLAAWEGAGRPVRESLLDFLRGGGTASDDEAPTAPAAPEGDTPTGENGVAAAASEGKALPLTPPPSPLPPLPALPRPFFGRRPSGPAAEAEISALEQRVRELEQQVGNPEESAPPPTPADEATFVPGGTETAESLADSAYAISETVEEVEHESREAGE